MSKATSQRFAHLLSIGTNANSILADPQAQHHRCAGTWMATYFPVLVTSRWQRLPERTALPFSEAIAEGLCELNPASELRHIAAKAPDTVHYPHLLEADLPNFLRALKASTSRHLTKEAVWMLLRTASRPGMVRFAEWREISLEDGLWIVPAEKMKMRRNHIVPLPTQTLSSLKEIRLQTGRQRLIFPGQGSRNPVLSENTINQVLCKIGYKGKLVGHGARHTASTLLREHGWNKDYVEAQLAHKEAGVAGVYNQAQYLDQRREMMQWYADYLDALGEKD
jgi:integrase